MEEKAFKEPKEVKKEVGKEVKKCLCNEVIGRSTKCTVHSI